MADLLSTRRGPDGTLDALAVWSGFRAGLVGDKPLEPGLVADVRGDPRFDELDRAMDDLAGHIHALRTGSCDLSAARLAALRVADACRDLLSSLRVNLG